MKFGYIKSMLLGMASCGILCSCSAEASDVQLKRISVNSCIQQLNTNYEDIRELNCDPGSEVSLLGADYDLLGKLVNLEKIRFVGIAKDDDAQNFFSALSDLKKLKTVEIVDSKIGSIDKLGDLIGLETLNIYGNPGGGSWFTIDDIDLLGTDERFSNLNSLSLKFINLSEIPDLRKLTKLESFSVSGNDITSIAPDSLNWENLKSLDLSLTSVSSFDEAIAEKMMHLSSLNLSYTKISDLNFVLKMPELKDFVYACHSVSYADTECLMSHPNYTDKWSAN